MLLLSLGSNITVIVGVVIFIAVVIPLVIFVPVGLWITARFSGVKLNIGQLIGMRLRRVPPKLIVDELIKASKAGLDKVSFNKVETHYLAHGNISVVIDALIAAKHAHIALDFQQAAAIDLAGRDLLQAVKDSVNPKVIDSPKIEAVSKDGIQLLVKARITVIAHIDKLIGGAGEETIIARVGEGIVSAVGSSHHADVLESPARISNQILGDGLTARTAYDVISIDIADVDVGKSIGAILKADEAEADLKVAQAKAEEKRAEAVAEEQHYRAQVQRMKAKLIEAESQVPLAISDSFRMGKLGIMDYYRLQNMDADTRMRRSFSEMESEEDTSMESKDSHTTKKDD